MPKGQRRSAGKDADIHRRDGAGESHQGKQTSKQNCRRAVGSCDQVSHFDFQTLTEVQTRSKN